MSATTSSECSPNSGGAPYAAAEPDSRRGVASIRGGATRAGAHPGLEQRDEIVAVGASVAVRGERGVACQLRQPARGAVVPPEALLAGGDDEVAVARLERLPRHEGG